MMPSGSTTAQSPGPCNLTLPHYDLSYAMDSFVNSQLVVPLSPAELHLHFQTTLDHPHTPFSN